MILSHIVSTTITVSCCALLLSATVHLTKFVADYQHKQQALSQWQRAMVILQRDACNTSTYIWQGDRLRLGRATWYQRGDKVFRHDGKSRHAVALIHDVQAMRILRQAQDDWGSMIIICNNKEYEWPILCSP